MFNKWRHDLRKINSNHYALSPESFGGMRCALKITFMQLAFDNDEETLVLSDTAGYLYYIDLCSLNPYCVKGRKVGQTTFLAFNPIDKNEVIVGLVTGDIKLCKINTNSSKFCLLTAHHLPPIHISFFKNYCLTSSQKEVIVWCLKSASKIQQLKINAKSTTIKKASFSNLGHIAALYQNDMIQVWMLKQLDIDCKIDMKSFGIRNVRDFVFTKDGRAMIVAGAQKKLIVLGTCNWSILKQIKLSDNFVGIKNLAVMPMPLDGGSNKIIASVSLDCTLMFFDLESACFLDVPKLTDTIKKMSVSTNGRYLAYIERKDNLNIIVADGLFLKKPIVTHTIKERCRTDAHETSDHLKCVSDHIKRELSLERLLPILKEFGEYPNKYRAIIWSTILNLPYNRCSYNALANESTYAECTTELLKNYTLANRSKQIVLQTTLNCLLQWCPLLIQSKFIPNFIFPFLTVFEKDPLRGFEGIVSILLNYCQKWFEYHPLPPLNVLGVIENILMEVDPILLKSLCERGIASSEYAWPLLRTAMSEVLPGTEWLILWDHLISYRRPSLFIICVIAYNVYTRDVIISLPSERCKQFYTTQSHVKAAELIKLTQRLDREIPSRLHPNRYLRDELIALPGKSPYPPFLLYTDYPKFVTEDSSILVKELSRAREHTLRERKMEELEKAEEERLRHELRGFMARIHQSRLNEVQKCLQEQVYDMDWPADTMFNKVQTNNLYHSEVPLLNLKESLDIDSEVFGDEKRKHWACKKMQKDVDNLAHEVQDLLDSLRSQKSGTVI